MASPNNPLYGRPGTGSKMGGLANSPCNNRLLKAVITAGNNPKATNQALQATASSHTVDVLYEAYANGILSGPLTHAINIFSNATTVAWNPTEDLAMSAFALFRGDAQQSYQHLVTAGAQLHGLATGFSDILRLGAKQADWAIKEAVPKGVTNKTRKGLSYLTGNQADLLKVGKKPTLRSLGVPDDLLRSHELAKSRIKPALASENFLWMNSPNKNSADSVLKFAARFGTDSLGNVIRLPGAALISEDKLFKLLHYRMATAKSAAQAAMAKPKGHRFAEYSARKMLPNETAGHLATDIAEYWTFTNALGKKGSTIQRAISYTPAKMFIPFFKTPTNIVKVGLEHSLGGLRWNNLKTAFKPGAGAAGDYARTKLAMGTVLPMTIIANLPEDEDGMPRITGSVNTATPWGKYLQDMGVPAYSVKVGDEWFSYEKVEPFRSILGLYVNYKEAFGAIDFNIDDDAERENPLAMDLGIAAIAPVIETIGDNYLLEAFGGMVDFLDTVGQATNEREPYTNAKKEVSKYLTQWSISTLPLSNFWLQTNRGYFDSTYRKADKYVDQLKKRIPGQSDTLPASLTIWGDERVAPLGWGLDGLSPIRNMRVQYDKYDKELFRLKYPVPRERKHMYYEGVKIELTTQQQHDFGKIRGKGSLVENSVSVPLKEVLKGIMDDPDYQFKTDEERSNRIGRMFAIANKHTTMLMFETHDDLKKQFERKWDQLRKDYEDRKTNPVPIGQSQ